MITIENVYEFATKNGGWKTFEKKCSIWCRPNKKIENNWDCGGPIGPFVTLPIEQILEEYIQTKTKNKEWIYFIPKTPSRKIRAFSVSKKTQVQFNNEKSIEIIEPHDFIISFFLLNGEEVFQTLCLKLFRKFFTPNANPQQTIDTLQSFFSFQRFQQSTSTSTSTLTRSAPSQIEEILIVETNEQVAIKEEEAANRQKLLQQQREARAREEQEKLKQQQDRLKQQEQERIRKQQEQERLKQEEQQQQQERLKQQQQERLKQEEQERIRQQQQEQERLKQQEQEQQQKLKQQEQERLKQQQQEEQQRFRQQQEQQERLKQEQQEQEKIRQEQQEQERIKQQEKLKQQQEQQEQEKIRQQQEEQERIKQQILKQQEDELRKQIEIEQKLKSERARSNTTSASSQTTATTIYDDSNEDPATREQNRLLRAITRTSTKGSPTRSVTLSSLPTLTTQIQPQTQSPTTPTPKRVFSTPLSTISAAVVIADEIVPYEILLTRPKHLIPNRLETYLSNEEFVRIFNVDRAQFYSWPEWKRTAEKRRVNYFNKLLCYFLN
eukprot:TRINITY_DN934_c0_g1_i5.p1 TRINITY_DN934_c0_g1~~TRINITY_DN934_c0_g1_i5.p1  ORF type:complete len:552 (+),score=307.35 TRINITY_DN934_c0_g1_i5:58-1713(+)